MQTHKNVKHPREFLLRETSAIGRFNIWLANKLGSLLGSMVFFYICVLLDIAELPAVIQAHSAIAWITYVSQTVIQLIALPILSTQSNMMQAKNEAKANADHLSITYIANTIDEIKKLVK